jgi:hypothetical protein
MHVGMPVETTTLRVNGAEHNNIQRTFAGGVQQVIDIRPAEVVKEPVVDLKQRPEL